MLGVQGRILVEEGYLILELGSASERWRRSSLREFCSTGT